MPKHILTFVVSILFAIGGFAQSSSISGQVKDTSQQLLLEQASVIVLKAKDSILVKHTRTDKNGKFAINDLQAGKYILLITYPRYASFEDIIDINESSLQLGIIALITRAKLLEEVIVRSQVSAIRIKGDTLEFKADSFKVGQNANVEDLLKRLPGIQVNAKGEITAQGRRVQKVLVDGEEFFGDDPTLATQNLAAKAVDKVQVFERKSNEAVATGIDDGVREQTVNLVLKEDAKKGYFGRAEAGSDLNEFYDARLLANRFKGSKKLGGYVTTNRTGRNNINWEDAQNFGGGNFTSGVNEDGGMFISFQSDQDFSGTEGIPTNTTAGVMFNNKYGKLKNSTQNNYNFRNQLAIGDGRTTTQFILPDTVFFQEQARVSNAQRWRHQGSTRNELKLDSLTTIQINVNGQISRSTSDVSNTDQTKNEERNLVNEGIRTRTQNSLSQNLNTELFITRKLNSKGSLLTATVSNRNSYTSGDGFLFNTNNFFNPNIGSLDSSVVTNQLKTIYNKSNTFNSRLSYNQPLAKRLTLNLNYSFQRTNNENDNRSFEQRNGKYDSLNMIFSNHFIFDNTSHTGGFKLAYKQKKWNVQAGLGIQNLLLEQRDLFKDTSLSRSFTNFNPTANFSWKFSSSGNFNVSYNGTQQAPSLAQIAPLIDNNNPLMISIGNPALKPSFNHNINFWFGDFKVISERNIYAYGNINITDNAFSTREIIGSNGVRTFQTVNVKGNIFGNLYVSYNRKLGNTPIDFELQPNVQMSVNNNFVNGLANKVTSYSLGIQTGFGYYGEEDKISIWLGYEPEWNNSVSSIQRNLQTAFWIHTITSDISWKLPKDWTIKTNLSANFRQQTEVFGRNVNAIIWNADIEKKIVKKKNIFLTLSANDILNQNIGFSRNIRTNMIQENTFLTVQRFFLLGFRWKFNGGAMQLGGNNE